MPLDHVEVKKVWTQEKLVLGEARDLWHDHLRHQMHQDKDTPLSFKETLLGIYLLDFFESLITLEMA
jgi:hypothetical protein